MSIATLAILALVQAFQPVPIYGEQISPNEAAERASKCGLGNVAVGYDSELQAQVLIPAVKNPATEEQLICLDQSTQYFPVQLPPDEQTRFDAIRSTRYQAAFDKYAREWAAARGLLDRVPKYERGVVDERAVAREIETLCGPRARGAFQSSFGPRTLSPDWLGREIRKKDFEDVLGCLMNISRVAGFDLGLVGNEAISAPK